MKHRSWLHWKGGSSKITGPQRHAARVVLGQLKGMLGTSTTGALRRTLNDGTLIEAFFNAGIPSVRVTPVGGVVEPSQTLISTMHVTLIAPFGIQAIAAAPAGKYRVLAPETYVQTEGVGLAIPESYNYFDAATDPIGIHATKDGKSVMLNTYTSGGAFSDSLIEIETTNFDIVRNTYLGVGSIEGVYGGSWCTVSTDDYFYVGTQFGSDFDGGRGIMEVSRDLTAPFPTRLFNTLPTISAIFDMAITKDGRYLFAVDFFEPAVAVIDISLGVVVASFTFSGMSGADAIELSKDNQRLYLLGDHLPDAADGQDRVLSHYALSFNDDGVFLGASFLGKIRGGDPQSLRLTPNGEKLYVSDGVNNYIMEYDVAQMPGMPNLVTEDGLTSIDHPGRIKIPIASHTGNYLIPFRFSISPDGKYLYYPAGGTGDPELEFKVLVLSLRTYGIVAEVGFSSYPVAVTLSNELKDY